MPSLDFEAPLLKLEKQIARLRELADADPKSAMQQELSKLQARALELQREIFEQLSAWQKVQLSRHPERPHSLDYVSRLCEGFVELHGDRRFADDPAIIAGFARFEGQVLAIVGHQKGRSNKEKARRNFGMAHPEGFRKAQRVLKLAERFQRPVLALIDTQGAYPGIGAEERGQSEAIGECLYLLSRLSVPVVIAVIGEGGSGGALALAIGDRVLMQRYAVYSVISPEGCASILWRDAALAPEAAEALKLTAEDALGLGLVDELVPEPIGGAHRNWDEAAEHLRKAIRAALFRLRSVPLDQLLEQRYQKFRKMGVFLTPQS